jgi:hypothetical protein
MQEGDVMNPIRRVIPMVLALSLGLGVIAAGCGGDDDSSADLTRAELSTKATQICTPVTKSVNQALGQVFGSQNPSPQAFAAAVNSTVLPEFNKQIDQLAALNPPSDLSGRYDAYIDSARETADKLGADPSGPFTGNPEQFYGDSNAKAKAAGLPTVCLAGPQAT